MYFDIGAFIREMSIWTWLSARVIPSMARMKVIRMSVREGFLVLGRSIGHLRSCSRSTSSLEDKAHHEILVVVSKSAPEDINSAYMFSILFDTNTYSNGMVCR